MLDTILQARDLTFAFPQQQVFNDFSVAIPAGITYIVGDENTGKSTLLKLFAGDLTSQAGSIAIGGLGSTINQADNLAFYQQHVFWADPRASLHDRISPNDYFDLQRRFYPAFNDAVLLELLDGLSLSDHVAKAMYMLSAGSKRKVWLAAAFASGAAVTLLDEPFAALDKASINFLTKQLETFAQNPSRAWVVADYEVPANLTTQTVIDLDL
jgi:ABC-type multidrug transport system ATPase subunit